MAMKTCLYQLRKAGAILSLGNDIRAKSHHYWVIHVTMSREALPDVIFGAMRGSPLWYLHGELTGSFNKVLKDTQAEMSYTVIVEQETFLPSAISFNSKRINHSEVPSNGAGVDRPVLCISTVKNSGSCQIYGFGESFTVPDVSSATPGYMPEG